MSTTQTPDDGAVQHGDARTAKTDELESLRASETRYRRLFESARDGILILDAETGYVVDVNPFLANLLGYSREIFLTKKVWELGFLKDAIANEEQFRELQAKDYVRYEDLPLETSDGRTIEVEFISNVYLVNEQRVIQCNIRDITERKQAELQIRFQADIIDNSPVIAAYHDKDLNVVWVNKAYQKATGLSLEQAREKKCYQVWNLSKPCRGCPVLKAIETGENATHELTPDNQDHWPETQGYWLSQAVPIRDEQDTVLGALEFAIDITGRKRAEEEHDKLHAQLAQAQKMESVGRLAGGVAHDFNNLLMGIMGYAELCREKIAPDHPIREYLDEITHGAERSAEITRQLLAFARKQNIAPKILDLNDAVAGMLKLLQRLIGEDIKITWRPGSHLRPVKLDPSQVDQILANLCVNARDAIAGVGELTLETGSITIDAEYCAGHAEAIPGAYVFLAVSDNGCGMDKETLVQVFEPFFTTKGVGEGTGLGLATVYGIVKQNNGFIYAYSEPGKGTTFKIYLPEIAAEAEAPVTRKAVAPRGRGETILLVEDEKSLRVTCGAFLDALGYKVMVAETPGEALKMVARHPGDIHVLLTDVVMPGMDGRQLAKRLAAVKPGVKVLFMSGYTSDVIAQRGVLDEGVQFLAKPFTRDDLARKVRELLEAD